VIDLHMHTTASDGTCTPPELVAEVLRVGIRTFAVADHDTVAAVDETVRLASDAGVECIPAIEITAVHESKDVHVLGYFIDVRSTALLRFLEHSRRDRLRRAALMCERLGALGVPIDFDQLLTRAGGPNSGKAIARPIVARALLEAGHVPSIQEAFDRFLAEGRPAYCPRVGATPGDVVKLIAEAGGIASLAHPGTLKKDALIESLARNGLCALECFHSDHDEATTTAYLTEARRLGLGVTGGSDFHGPATRRAEYFGTIGLPQPYYDDLLARASGTAARSG
jgi:predicted metal-dependent phosphoesterase TrpH